MLTASPTEVSSQPDTETVVKKRGPGALPGQCRGGNRGVPFIRPPDTYPAFMKFVGAVIRHHRLAMGMTQQDLASLSGTFTTVIQQTELHGAIKGKAFPLALAIRIARILGISVSALVPDFYIPRKRKRRPKTSYHRDARNYIVKTTPINKLRYADPEAWLARLNEVLEQTNGHRSKACRLLKMSVDYLSKPIYQYEELAKWRVYPLRGRKRKPSKDE